MAKRSANHANSWYTGDRKALSTQLEAWLSIVAIDGVAMPIEGARIIIAPHAGYAYSGAAAAWAYKSLDVSKAKRVFVIGPSHHIYIDNCALSSCHTYATPLGDLRLDTEVLKQLHSTEGELFQWMRLDVDEEEHSIEMQLPYIYKILEKAGKLNEVKVVPIMVGAISSRKEKAYGEVLAEHLKNPENVFVISSDFCHWGTRFSYTHYYSSLPSNDEPYPPSVSLDTHCAAPPSDHPVYQSIEALDRRGMYYIESGSHDDFSDYLKKTHNTICGRHPIGVIMAGIQTIEKQGAIAKGAGRFRFVRYEHSSQCRVGSDSSVSYASAYAVL
ncbi:MEMO1 family [Geopyxis carbonaria]|nr:MEMO1 family [Geopyxis carbonaria]